MKQGYSSNARSRKIHLCPMCKKGTQKRQKIEMEMGIIEIMSPGGPAQAFASLWDMTIRRERVLSEQTTSSELLQSL